jgi:hypothetical protein
LSKIRGDIQGAPPVSKTLVANLPPVSLVFPLGPFRIFSKIRGDIGKSRCTTGINDTGGKFATSFASVVDTGGKFATGVNDTGGKFAAGVTDTGGNLPPVSTTPAANLPPVSITPVANNWNNIRLLRP